MSTAIVWDRCSAWPHVLVRRSSWSWALLLSIMLLFCIVEMDAEPWTEQFLKDISDAGDKFIFKQHHLGKHFELVTSMTEQGVSRRSLRFQCSALFQSHSKANASQEYHPPRHPPPVMLNSFTLDGAVTSHDMYCTEEQQNGGAGYVWSASELDRNGKSACQCGQYNKPFCDQAIARYGDVIKNKSGYVFGSQKPWAESALLAAGAASVTTVEYMSITTDHPRLLYIHPFNLTAKYLRGHKGADFAWSYSSLEHDGLGRYGDPINPFADLESIYRIHCLLRPGGVLFLGFPVGPDALYWNAHRIYGPLRLYLVLSGWEVMDVIGLERRIISTDHLGDGAHQPVIVLRKPLLT